LVDYLTTDTYLVRHLMAHYTMFVNWCDSTHVSLKALCYGYGI